MYELGMMREPEEIKLLILFAAYCLKKPVEKDDLIETISPGETVNYFDLMNVFDDLYTSGHMDIFETDGKSLYIMTPLGKETIQLLERSLPFTIREKVAKNALKVLAKIRYNSMIFTSKDVQNGGCLVSLNIKEEGDILMQMKLMVANEAQADAIIRVFDKNPSRIYRKFIETLVIDIKELEKETEETNKNEG